MLIARLEGIRLSYGTYQVLDGVSLSLNDGEKIGLIGPNGAGKSSLLKVLAGVERPQEGDCTLRGGITVAYLPQEYAGEGAGSAFDEVLLGRPDLLEIEHRLAAVEARLADPEQMSDLEQFAQAVEEQQALFEEYEEMGGPRLRNEARGCLVQLGLPEDMHDHPLDQLSGGQQKMIGLARCLITKPDLMLLDEPDNHLDLAGKARLEEVLRKFTGAVILISHDRYLLDDTIAQVIELDGGQLTVYEGNYSSYAAQREIALLKQQQDYVAQQKEIQRLEAAIARFSLWAKMVVDERHIKQARNKQRQIDRMEKIERPVLERRKIGLSFRSSERGGQKVLEARHLAKAFDDEIVLLDIDFTLWRGDRVGLVGANGSGKSVLFSLLLGLDQPNEGSVWVGPSIRIGYYAQGHETLNLDWTPVDEMRALRPIREDEAVAFLGRFLFSYAQSLGPISRLSGGEKSRLQLAKLMLSGVNCLLLDEPTNHLDIASTEVLEGALERFDGTVLTISHDRYFLDRTCNRILELEDGEVREYHGGYSEYLEAKSRLIEVV